MCDEETRHDATARLWGTGDWNAVLLRVLTTPTWLLFPKISVEELSHSQEPFNEKLGLLQARRALYDPGTFRGQKRCSSDVEILNNSFVSTPTVVTKVVEQRRAANQSLGWTNSSPFQIRWLHRVSISTPSSIPPAYIRIFTSHAVKVVTHIEQVVISDSLISLFARLSPCSVLHRLDAVLSQYRDSTCFLVKSSPLSPRTQALDRVGVAQKAPRGPCHQTPKFW